MCSLNPDQVNLVSRKLVDWLRYASMQQGASMSSGGFFGGPRTRQVGHVAFLYSSVPSTSIKLRHKFLISVNCSSLVNISSSACSTDGGGWGGNGWLLHCAVFGSELHWGQWMNMYTFSMIKSWLLTYDTEGTTNTESGSPVGLLYNQCYFSITYYIIW